MEQLNPLEVKDQYVSQASGQIPRLGLSSEKETWSLSQNQLNPLEVEDQGAN